MTLGSLSSKTYGCMESFYVSGSSVWSDLFSSWILTGNTFTLFFFNSCRKWTYKLVL